MWLLLKHKGSLLVLTYALQDAGRKCGIRLFILLTTKNKLHKFNSVFNINLFLYKCLPRV